MFLDVFKGKKPSKKDKLKVNTGKNEHPSSEASISTASYSVPETPPTYSFGPVLHETRGIFRTLEAKWYYHISLSALSPSEESFSSREASDDMSEWVLFDEASQNCLEAAYRSPDQSSSYIPSTSLGPCTVLFEPPPMKAPKPKKKKRPVTVEISGSIKNNIFHQKSRSASSIVADERQSKSPPPPLPLHKTETSLDGLVLALNHTVRRSVSPAWWYEQDCLDGTKGMCLFDYKNQARLEALAEGKSCFTMTDDAFAYPFKAIMDTSKSKDLPEECYGMIHWEIPVTKLISSPDSHPFDQLEVYMSPTHEMYVDPNLYDNKHTEYDSLGDMEQAEHDVYQDCVCGSGWGATPVVGKDRPVLVRRHST